MNNKNKAFTLVELIVALTILVILTVIATFSFISYSSSTRDTSRIIEFKNIEHSMYSYVMKTGFYPTPGEPVDVFYSGGLVWTQ
jgi:prepilin-type N-terminal cleavage/methylation domain-containing protein